MMKKLIALLLVLVMMFSFAACKGKDETPSQQGSESGSNTGSSSEEKNPVENVFNVTDAKDIANVKITVSADIKFVDTSGWLGLCPEGKNYVTEAEADDVDVIWFAFEGREEKDPYIFNCDFSTVDDGTYALVVTSSDDATVGYVLMQLSMTKKGSTVTFDFKNAKLNTTAGSDQGENQSSGSLDPIGSINQDPAMYERDFWESKYPDANLCPFYIEVNGKEYNYYWISSLEGWDGTIGSWLRQPFNWDGWHKAADGAIVNKDETIKISDEWLTNALSSSCTVTTEKYSGSTAPEIDKETEVEWPFENYKKPENCKLFSIEEDDTYTKVYVLWENKDAVVAFQNSLNTIGGFGFDGGTTYQYKDGIFDIMYSEGEDAARFNYIVMYK